LRLVLWSLSKGLQTFSEAPPPGLVTVPVDAHAESGHDTICGYRNAGSRAIRIDMLERLADMLRGENSRTGFEAKADMLSITGMTLEQFADLMQGLGYQAVKGERVKTKAAQDPVGGATPEVDQPEISTALSEKEAFGAGVGAQEAALDVNPAKVALSAAEALASGSERDQAQPQEELRAASTAKADSQSAPAQPQSAETVAPELEVFYTFTWGHVAKKQSPARHHKPKHRAGDEKQARKSKGKQKPLRDKKGPKTFAAKPEKTQKIDPDNPFAAALMGLKTQDR
jgi:ATP-dependent RNA helicase SUPV3L1/SUV3